LKEIIRCGTMDDGAADLETSALEVEACELDRAITSLLQFHDPQANKWINDFVALPRAWSVSLYLAFPPPGSAAGVSLDVRFFSLNLLLSKIRGDQSQVPAEEAQEIYEALVRQLPLNLGNQMVGARLCLVVSGAAALAGADTCYELVEYIVGGFVDGPLAVELLISLAEETLQYATALPWQVGECMQECGPQVISYLQALIVAPGVQEEFVTRVIVCLTRWIRSGAVLSELYLENAPFLEVVLGALGSSDDATLEAAVAALSELLSAVDPLPGREDAMRAVISALLGQKGQFVAAMSGPILRVQLLLSLVKCS
jgi:transportin-3